MAWPGWDLGLGEQSQRHEHKGDLAKNFTCALQDLAKKFKVVLRQMLGFSSSVGQALREKQWQASRLEILDCDLKETM